MLGDANDGSKPYLKPELLFRLAEKGSLAHLERLHEEWPGYLVGAWTKRVLSIVLSHLDAQIPVPLEGGYWSEESTQTILKIRASISLLAEAVLEFPRHKDVDRDQLVSTLRPSILQLTKWLKFIIRNPIVALGNMGETFHPDFTASAGACTIVQRIFDVDLPMLREKDLASLESLVELVLQAWMTAQPLLDDMLFNCITQYELWLGPVLRAFDLRGRRTSTDAVEGANHQIPPPGGPQDFYSSLFVPLQAMDVVA